MDLTTKKAAEIASQLNVFDSILQPKAVKVTGGGHKITCTFPVLQMSGSRFNELAAILKDADCIELQRSGEKVTLRIF